MAEGEYHFNNIKSAAASLDGENVILYVEGVGGEFGLNVPTREIPRIVATLMTTSAEALQRSGSSAMRAIELKGITVMDLSSDERLLQLNIHQGGAPLALRMPRSALLDFARGLLQTEGVLPPDRTGGTQ